MRVGAAAADASSPLSPHHFVKEVANYRFWPIEYMLDDETGMQAVALFLSSLVYHKRDVQETEGPRFDRFLDFLVTWVLDQSSVKLSNLPKLLVDFKRRGALSRAEASEIEARINTTDAGGVWMMAVRAENFFPVAATLFPRRIRSIVRNEDDGGGKDKGEGEGPFKDQLQARIVEYMTKDFITRFEVGLSSFPRRSNFTCIQGFRKMLR